MESKNNRTVIKKLFGLFLMLAMAIPIAIILIPVFLISGEPVERILGRRHEEQHR